MYKMLWSHPFRDCQEFARYYLVGCVKCFIILSYAFLQFISFLFC